MKHMIFVVLVLLPTLLVAKCGCKELRNSFYAEKTDCKKVVFEDEETAIEYNYFNNILKEYEEGTDSWEEINALLNKEFVRVDHPDYVEVQMTDNLRRYLNGEDSDIED